MTNSAPITITETAAARVREILARAEKPVLGVRIGVRARGCAGMTYTLEYAVERKPHDEVVDDHGVRVFIDPAAVVFLLGAKMDYEEGTLDSGFVFHNPNERGRCGCGESFRV